MTNKDNEKIIKDLIKNNHDGKLFTEQEIPSIIGELSEKIDIVDKNVLSNVATQYLYYSKKDDKYFFNIRRRQLKKKEYHDKIISSFKYDIIDTDIDVRQDGDREIEEQTMIIKVTKETSNIDDDIEIHDELNKCLLEVKETEEEELARLEMELMDATPKYSNYAYPVEKQSRIKKHTESIYGPYGTQWYHDIQTNDILNTNAFKLLDQFNKLRAIPLPEQRSKEWYEMRDGKITASDGGTVLGVNEHEPQYKFILKKTGNVPFESNKYCYHGKKYEEIATLIYEYRMNIMTEEFGLIAHPVHKFLGASPDRICGPYKLNGRHKTKYVGRMLEIKCPLVRQIKMDGAIIANICPEYYWVQVQLQLECCDLDECDFWQCEIKEYESRQEFIDDTDNNESFRSLNFKFEKGCLIQLLPKSKMSEILNGQYDKIVYDEASFIYPPKIEMSPLDCDLWIAKTMANIHTMPKYKDYFFDKVLYWKLVKSKNVTILRDKKWFAESLPKLQKMWDYVIFLRNNKDKTDLLMNYINTRTRKMNKDIMSVVEKIYNTTAPNYDLMIRDLVNTVNGVVVDKKNMKNNDNDDATYMFV